MQVRNDGGLSKSQVKAAKYMQQHGVEQLLGDMVNSLVHSRPDNPIIFMVSRRRC